MESPRPEYTGELLRHFADLRDGTHGDARSRRDKERLFTAAVALLDPHARRALREINTDLLLGTGEVTATGVRCRGNGRPPGGRPHPGRALVSALVGDPGRLGVVCPCLRQGPRLTGEQMGQA